MLPWQVMSRAVVVVVVVAAPSSSSVESSEEAWFGVTSLSAVGDWQYQVLRLDDRGVGRVLLGDVHP